MFKFFETVAKGLEAAVGGRRYAVAACVDCPRDPMDHPTIATMDLTRLADLPAAQLRPQSRI